MIDDRTTSLSSGPPGMVRGGGSPFVLKFDDSGSCLSEKHEGFEISTHRPGARKEKVEEYTRRLRHIEDIAASHMGVRQAFALQNGKEVRVLVDSVLVDDTYADQLADEITAKIEQEIEYTGQLRVCLVREVRAVQYAR